MHREALVQDVSAWQVQGEWGSEFVIEATALPGIALDRIEETIRHELSRLAVDGPDQ